MPKEAFFGEMAARMARFGWPGRQVRRILQEVADHWNGLDQEARECGLSDSDAAEFARARLGNPAALLKSYEHTMRTSSWAGRHPVLGFVLLPPVALAVWFMWWTALAAGAGEMYAKLLNLKTPAWGSYLAVLFGVKVIHYTGVFAIPALFWLWARNSFHGFQWRWIACAVCSLHGVLNHVTVRPHQLQWGYGIAPVDWVPVLAPLLVAVVARICERPRRIRAAIPLACACLLLAGCESSKLPQQRGWIGGEYKPAGQLKRNSKGLLVTSLRTNTPAARSGLREGDLILQAAGEPLNNLAAFQQVIDAAQPGASVPISIVRDGTPLGLDVRAGRETFTRDRSLVVGLLLSREWDPWPNPDFSLVALGYKRQHKRLDLTSPESQFKLVASDDHASLRTSEGWKIWLPIVSFSSRKCILSQSESPAP
jgi:hypothetical protein